MPRLSPSFAVAALALVVACSGGAYAAAKIGSAQIKDNSVQSRDVRNGTLTGRDVKDGSLTPADVRAGLPSTMSAGVVMGNGSYSSGCPQSFHFPAGHTPGSGASSMAAAGMVVPVALVARDLTVVTERPGAQFYLLVNGQRSALTCTTPASSTTGYRCSNTTARVRVPAGAVVALEQYRLISGGTSEPVPLAFGWRATTS
ncbi:hypothetical protein [Nocardioides sp. SYSU D00038]|uniref:hypothetical protein n=1 Tax=Nocardioides sp. SYSU D00038 TaxID=2812554 RepID=UPI0019687513|nr:hypothetical protein [Nocardioides sp. SYSU D00038]